MLDPAEESSNESGQENEVGDHNSSERMKFKHKVPQYDSLSTSHKHFVSSSLNDLPSLTVDAPVANDENERLLSEGREINKSLDDLRVDSVRNELLSSSNLSLKHKTLSASNLAALSDSKLSLRVAQPLRAYNVPNSKGSSTRVNFETLAKKYYFQLTVGCGDLTCKNRFCAACRMARYMKRDAATILALQLASYGEVNMCKRVRENPATAVPIPRPPPSTNEEPKSHSFLQSLFSCSPFQDLFEKPAIPVKKPVEKKSVQEKVATGLFSSFYNFKGMPEVDLTSGSKSAVENELVIQNKENDLISETEFSLTHLTLESLKNAIEGYRTYTDHTFLTGTLRTVFSSSESLNMSFRIPGKDGRVDHSLRSLDIDDVVECYDLILGLEPKELFVNTLANAQAILLSDLFGKSMSEDDLFQVIILLHNPLLEQDSYRESLLRRLCLVIAHQRHTCREALVDLFSRYTVSRFVSIVNIFQAYLSAHLQRLKKPDKTVVACVHVLSMLYSANETHFKRNGVRLTDYMIFNNDALSRKTDFKSEYQSWMKLKLQNITGTSEKTKCQFSFFDYPFLLDPASKSKLLHIDSVIQMSRVFENAFVQSACVFHAQKIFEDSEKVINMTSVLRNATCPYLLLEVRRDHLIEDTLAQIERKKGDLKKPLKIKYVCGGEEGMDMGGVQKEFFQTVVEKIFEQDFAMFSYNEETRSHWFVVDSPASAKEYELVGTILGLAIYNGVILNVRFPLTVYKKLLGYQVGLEDLKESNPSLGKGLQQLLDFDGDVESIFCRTFQIAYNTVDGNIHYIDLKKYRSRDPDEATDALLDFFSLEEDESAEPVTNTNRQEFVRLYTDFLLRGSIESEFNAFSRGFHSVCGGDTLQLFLPEELELLACGNPVLDFHSLEKVATYDDGYHCGHKVIEYFWSVVQKMDEEHKKLLLMFVTGSDRVPIKGLSNMSFIVQRNGPDSDRLPTALTCFSRLLLPEYSSKAKLKNRLYTAIENGKGFGLV